MEQKKEEKRLEKTLEIVNFWIDKADTKVNLSLGLFPLLFTIMKYINSNYYRGIIESSLLFSIVDSLCIFLMIVAIVCFLLALVPKLGSSGSLEKKKYPLYYGDICRFKKEEYKSIMAKITDGDYSDELLNEIYCNSKICYTKMIKFKAGIILSIMSVLLEIGCFAVLRFFL